MSDDEGYAPAAQMLICFIFRRAFKKIRIQMIAVTREEEKDE